MTVRSTLLQGDPEMARNRKGCASLTTRNGCLVLLVVIAVCGAVRAADERLYPPEKYSQRHRAYLNFNMTSNATRNEYDGLTSALKAEEFHNILHTDPRFKEHFKPNRFSPEEAKLLECLGATNDKNIRVNNVLLDWAQGVQSKRWENWLKEHPNPFAEDFKKQYNVDVAEWRHLTLPKALFGNYDQCSPGDYWSTFQSRFSEIRQKWARFGFMDQIVVDGAMLALAPLPNIQHRQQQACLPDRKSSECRQLTSDLNDRLRSLDSFLYSVPGSFHSRAVDDIVDFICEEANETRWEVKNAIYSELYDVFTREWKGFQELAERLKSATHWPFAGKGTPRAGLPMRARVEAEFAAIEADRVVINLEAVLEGLEETERNLRHGREIGDSTLVVVNQAMTKVKQNLRDTDLASRKAGVYSGLVAYEHNDLE